MNDNDSIWVVVLASFHLCDCLAFVNINRQQRNLHGFGIPQFLRDFNVSYLEYVEYEAGSNDSCMQVINI